MITIEDNKNVHSGHRKRVKERFCESGLSSFADHTVLELVLYYSIPRKDTNVLAHKLLDHFGSLHAVFEAELGRLMEVPGISYNSAVHIKLFPEVFKRYSMSKAGKKVVFSDYGVIADYVSGLFFGESAESLYVICLDGRNAVISCTRHSTGSASGTSVSNSMIIDDATCHKARGIVIAHNHPATIAEPSPADYEVTKKLYHLLKEMDIELVDHIIFGCDGKCASIRDRMMLDGRYGVML